MARRMIVQGSFGQSIDESDYGYAQNNEILHGASTIRTHHGGEGN